MSRLIVTTIMALMIALSTAVLAVSGPHRPPEAALEPEMTTPTELEQTAVLVEPEQPAVVIEPEVAQPSPAPVYYAPTGDWVTQCYAWAAEAGVPLDDAAIKLLERESHCNPTAWNASSGAGGIPQALPFSKTGCELSVEGAVCQITWFYNYVVARYGSYVVALQHSYDTGWY